MYAEIAVNTPVHQTFHYHIPPELDGLLVQGHLVQVGFRTGQQHGIVLALHESTDIAQTKPVLALLDPDPVVEDWQIALAQWMSETYLVAIGPCLWLMLPPGLATGKDIRVTLVDETATSKDALETQVLDLLKRRGALRGHQFNLSIRGKPWRDAVDALTKAGIVHTENILAMPRLRPKMVQTAMLAIHPDEIPVIAHSLGKKSRRADLLEALAEIPGGQALVKDLIKRVGATRDPLNKLAEAGLVWIDDDTVGLNIPSDEVEDRVLDLRGAGKLLHILRVLARENDVMSVSWLYAQTGADLADLKRLEADDLIILGEKQSWRDSLAERDFVPANAPTLTREQAVVWERIREVIGFEEVFPSPDTPNPTPNPVAQTPSHILNPTPDPDTQTPPLTPPRIRGGEQNEGFQHNKNHVFLLHGVTGSGKTEIYLRAMELTLKQGRDAIFLVPEIALTAQTLRRVAARFSGQVAIVHSKLSPGERYDTWRRARAGLIRIVVGARSALFTPLRDVGLVILDEEHDPSYKQDEPTPNYHARQVAEMMMRLRGGVVILGSATPDIESVYRAERGEIERLHMGKRIMGHRTTIQEQSAREGVQARYQHTDGEDALTIDLPPVQVVDMRRELKIGNTSIFSRALEDALTETLERGEQAILYINRRGQATYVFCRDCGYVAKCHRCDTPLTYHRHGQALRCHHCGHQEPEPTICPECRSRRIKYFGAGTQQVEETVRGLFPLARTLRWDADTADTPQAHESILQQFIERKADVVIGTQMVAKGLDLPLVTLVGVVSADMGLALPDFRAGERVFQLLTQVAGRAGRGLLGGQVILQTYQPEHYVIQAASEHDYTGFYAQEIAYRRDLGYPPFRRIVRVLFRDRSEVKAQAEAERAASMLRGRMIQLGMTGTELIGPAPCFFTRVNDTFRWHVLLRGPDPTVALRGFDFPRGWSVDVDPEDVL